MTETTTAAEARARLLGAATDQVVKSILNNCQLLGLTVPDMIEVGGMAMLFIAARHAFADGERDGISFLLNSMGSKSEQVANAVVLERATKSGRSN